MPLNITPASAPTGDKSAPATRYNPLRSSAGMNGNTAPIPGMAPDAAQAPRPGARPAAPDARELAGDAANDQRDPAAAAEGQDGADEGKGEQDPDLAWRLGVVAKKDREARVRLQEAKSAEARLKAERDAIAAERRQLDEDRRANEERAARWRRDPKALLQDNGYVPETALQYMLNGEKLSPEQQMKVELEERLAADRTERQTELERLREEQTRKDQEREQQRQREEDEERQSREQEAIASVHSDIGEIIAGDPKTYRLVAKAGERGVSAIFRKVEEISNKQLEETGRRPQLTTRLLERATAEIEAAARKELQDTLADQDLAETLGFAGTRPQLRPQARPNTLTNDLSRGNANPAPAKQETEAERRERVKGQLDAIFKRRAGL